MQIGRLFEMVYLLLERENITAKELAQRFEVSERTVYRGIPKVYPCHRLFCKKSVGAAA